MTATANSDPNPDDICAVKRLLLHSRTAELEQNLTKKGFAIIDQFTPLLYSSLKQLRTQPIPIQQAEGSPAPTEAPADSAKLPTSAVQTALLSTPR